MFGKRQHMTVPAFTLAVISAVLLISALPAHGQTETVIHNFASFPDRLLSTGRPHFIWWQFVWHDLFRRIGMGRRI